MKNNYIKNILKIKKVYLANVPLVEVASFPLQIH